MQNHVAEAVQIPTTSCSHIGDIYTLIPVGPIVPDKPTMATPISLLSARPLSEGQIELGKKIAAKHGLAK